MSAISATLPRVRTLSPRIVLAAIVVLGAVLNELLATTSATPILFPDEYLYSQLGRSLATTGHLAVRGVNPHFLPVLAPVLNAPFWLVHDIGLAYRLIQAENALFLSLAAIPTYLLARRLGATSRLSLAAAALAVAGPPALYSARLLAEPLAYPLFLAVLAVSVELLAHPTRRNQVLFLTFGALATLTRIQLALVPLCVALAVVVIGTRGRRLRSALREQRLLLGLIGGALVIGLAVLFVRGFGYYHLGPKAKSTVTAGRIAGIDVFVLLMGTGAALAPSAVVGLFQAVARPRSAREQAFGIVSVLFALGTIVQCVLWGDVQLVQERYLIYLLPVLTMGFCLRRSRPERRPVAEIGVAAAIAAMAAVVPLASYSIDDAAHIVPTLDAVARAQAALHSASNAAAVFALGTTVLAAFGAATVVLRRGALATMLVSLAAAVTLLGLATSYTASLSDLARHNFLPADAHWLDHAAPGEKTLVVIGNASKAGTLANLFWNPTVAHVVRTPGAYNVDWLDDPIAAVGPTGTLRVHGKPLTGTVVVSSDPYTLVVLADAKLLGAAGPLAAWHANGAARLGVLLHNRTLDGAALHTGSLRTWETGGWLEVPIGAPTAARVPAAVAFKSRSWTRTVHVAAGGTTVARIPVCGPHGWAGGFVASPATIYDGRWLAPTFGTPRFVPDPSACP